MVKSYRQLTAWEKAMNLAAAVYTVTEAFPKKEMYGLTQQMRRAAVSIPSNIAEGTEKSSTGEFLLFLGHAQGSRAELETQTILANRFGYLPSEETHNILTLSDEVGRLINGLKRSLKNRKKET